MIFEIILEKLVNDLMNAAATNDELNTSRRSSKMSVDEVKTVKFAAPTRTSTRTKAGANTAACLTSGQHEEMNTISTIRALLQ